MKTAQIKITESVKQYVKLFPEEYRVFKKETATKRSLQADKKLGQAKNEGIVERLVLEVPENLDQMIQTMLSPEEWKWFISKDGVIWFANEFESFRIPEHT